MPETLSISTEDCTIERDDRVVIITMNRPEKRNALSPAMLVGLADAYTYVDENDDVRAASSPARAVSSRRAWTSCRWASRAASTSSSA